MTFLCTKKYQDVGPKNSIRTNSVERASDLYWQHQTVAELFSLTPDCPSRTEDILLPGSLSAWRMLLKICVHSGCMPYCYKINIVMCRRRRLRCCLGNFLWRCDYAGTSGFDFQFQLHGFDISYYTIALNAPGQTDGQIIASLNDPYCRSGA